MSTPDSTFILGITMGVATVATLLFDLFFSVERKGSRKERPMAEPPHAKALPDPLAGIEVVRIATDGNGCHPAFVSSALGAARREVPAVTFATASGWAQPSLGSLPPSQLSQPEVLRRIGLNHIRSAHPLFRDPTPEGEVAYQALGPVAPAARPAPRLRVIRSESTSAATPRQTGHLRLITDGGTEPIE